MTWTLTRLFIAWVWMNRHDACSSIPCWSMSRPLARSMSLRASSRSSRSPTWRSSDVSSACRASATSMAGIRSDFWNGLTRYAERARVARLLHEVALRERGQDEDGREPLGRDVARRRQPVEAGHLHVEDDQVGNQVAHEVDGLVAAPGLADDLVALLLEQLLQVEADDRFVFGDDDTRSGTGTGGTGRGHRVGLRGLGGVRVSGRTARPTCGRGARPARVRARQSG